MNTKEINNPEKVIRISRLTSVARCGVEIGRVYRAARLGKITTSDASRLVQCLLGLKSCLETADVERRIELIEKGLDAANAPVPLRRVV